MATGLSGVFSGIDPEPLIQRVLGINNAPLKRLQTQRAVVESRRAAFNEIERLLNEFKTVSQKLSDASTFRQVSAFSTDKQVIDVSSSGPAVEGTYSIEVERLATAHRDVHGGVTSLTTTLGSSRSFAVSAGYIAPQDVMFTTFGEQSTYSINFGPNQAITGVTFEANTSYTLQDVADAINARSNEQFGYDAAVIEPDGSDYRIAISAEGYGPVGEMTMALEDGDEIDALAVENWQATDGDPAVFSYTYNGVTRNIATGDNTNLEKLRDLINNDSSNPGIRASILEHDSGDGKRFHLVLAGVNTGSDYGITINESTTLKGFGATEGDWATTEAQDSLIRVDGYPASEYISRSGNTISDVIAGITINLTGTGTANINASRQTQGLQNEMSNLVAIYNSLQTRVAQYTGYNAETGLSGILQGENAITSMLKSIRNTFAGVPAGFVDGKQGYIRASELGITTTKDGQIEFDTTVFADAVKDNYDAVAQLIGANGLGDVTSDYFTFNSARATTSTGDHQIEVTFNENGKIATARIRRNENDHWRNLDIKGNVITGREGGPEEGLSVSVTWDGVSTTQTTTVTVRNGLGAGLSNLVDDYLNTLLPKRKEYADSNISALDRNIERQQNRLTQIETRLRQQYARMEAQLANLDGQRAAYSALFSSIEQNKSNQ